MGRTVYKITQDYLKSTFDYDAVNGLLVRTRKGLGAKVGRPVGYLENGYRRVYQKGRNWQAKLLIWVWHYGAMPSEDILPINGNRSDDRIENLALRSQLRTPVKVYDNTTQYKNMYGDLPEENNTGIYEIRNITNGRIYIGSAVNISKRWREHLRQLETNRHHSKFMGRCWNKHGKDAFVFRVLENCCKEDLISKEQYYIDKLKPEYNTAQIAGSQLGYKHSKETRKKMSESRLKDFSPMTGKHHTEETRSKISATKTGVKLGKYNKDRVEKTAMAMRIGKNCLLEQEVKEIRRLKKLGFTAIKIANLIGRKVWPVYDVLQGKTYRWVSNV